VTSQREYVWDENKRAINLREHRIDFEAAFGFDWYSAHVFVDDREDHGELRENAIGFIGATLHVLTFTRRRNQIRIISLRKAHKNDLRRYVEAIR
jgi:uncharacterized DUF497 family protein